MTRLLRIVALIVALIALGGPSLSHGMGVQLSVAVEADTAPAELVAAKPWGCKSLGGKRVLPCHPDLGVMTSQVPPAAPSTRQWPEGAVALPLAATVPEAELPPPRLA